MPCIIALFTIAFPRAAMLLLYFFTTFFAKAYDSILILLIGFIFVPLTTIVYAWIVNAGHTVSGIYVVVLIVTVLVDLGLVGGGEYHRRRS